MEYTDQHGKEFITITREDQNVIRIDSNKTDEYSYSRSVEANLLFEILRKLEEIRCGLIDIEVK